MRGIIEYHWSIESHHEGIDGGGILSTNEIRLFRACAIHCIVSNLFLDIYRETHFTISALIIYEKEGGEGGGRRYEIL